MYCILKTKLHYVYIFKMRHKIFLKMITLKNQSINKKYSLYAQIYCLK